MPASDFYDQVSSIETNTENLATIGATLANGGQCPLTGDNVLSPPAVKSTLTLLFTCGMYNASGRWCVQVGLPAKGAASGWMYVIVPHVMSIAIYSPRLNSEGLPVRGVEFVHQLLQRRPMGVFLDVLPSAEELLAEAALSPAGAGAGAVGVTPFKFAAVHPDKPLSTRQGTTVQMSFQLRRMGHLALQKLRRLNGMLLYIRDNYPAQSIKTTGQLTTVRGSIGRAPTPHHVHLSSLQKYLKEQGISISSKAFPSMAKLLSTMQGTEQFWVSLVDVVHMVRACACVCLCVPVGAFVLLLTGFWLRCGVFTERPC